MSANSPKWRQALDAMASVTIVVTGAVIVWSLLSAPRKTVAPGPGAAQKPARPERPLPDAVSINRSAMRGSADAKAAVVEFSDFECPYCGAFVRDTLPKLEAEYVATGKAVLAFRHLPLDSLHKSARAAAIAADCAAGQGQFWPMHDLLFTDQKSLSAATFNQYSKSLKLDQNAFEACRSSNTNARVEADIREATTFGISGTPTFLLGRIETPNRVKVVAKLSGAAPIEKFRAAIDQIILATGR